MRVEVFCLKVVLPMIAEENDHTGDPALAVPAPDLEEAILEGPPPPDPSRGRRWP